MYYLVKVPLLPLVTPPRMPLAWPLGDTPRPVQHKTIIVLFASRYEPHTATIQGITNAVAVHREVQLL